VAIIKASVKICQCQSSAQCHEIENTAKLATKNVTSMNFFYLA